MKYQGLVYALIARRMALGWTQADLAERMRTTPNQVCKLETIAYEARQQSLRDWGDALGVHIDYSIRVKKPRGRPRKE